MNWPQVSRKISMALAGVFLLPVLAWGQSAEPSEIIRVDSDLVDLKVSVLRLNSFPAVVELRQSDFLVLEDGKQQEVAFFAGEETPFDLVLLLDLSGSTAKKLDLVRSSAKRFVETTRPTDRVGIVTFTQESRLVSPLTLDRKLLKESIKHIDEPVGGTNFWDALHYVLTSVLPAHNSSRRRAVVVMSDGVDNALPDVFGDGSQISFEQLITEVRDSDVIVFPVYLDTEKEELKRHRSPRTAYAIAREQLSQLAASGGTRVHTAGKAKDLAKVYDQVIKDLSTVYSLGYMSSNPLRDGKWRTVAVQIIGQPYISVRTKRGYYTKVPD